jgi:5-formyltetrahydrofolate cyclo-ligase
MTKAEWREAVLRTRRLTSPEQRRADAAALCGHLPALVRAGDTVCAYVPVGFEPGSPALLDALVDASFGLREPEPPWLGVDAIAAASVVLVPALAVDLAGVRLGRGAGFYDRSLSWAAPAARLVAVVRDDELVDRLPGADHDVPMTHALTPCRGLVALLAHD